MTVTLEEQAATDARDLIQFCEGITELYPELARRSRRTATDLLDILAILTAERSARQAIQASHDNTLQIISNAAYDAIR